MTSNWRDVIVAPDTTLREAIARIDESALQAALVLNDDGTLAGVVTDGDIRRAILRRDGLDIPVSEAMNTRPTSVPQSTPRNRMLALMRQKVIHHLPLVDDEQRVAGLVTIDELIGAAAHPNWVVLMAGGLGLRLRPLTADYPKPLLAVGGTPILETIVKSFSEQGFKQVFLAVNYRADLIQEHFGDGERWGVNIDYLHEDSRLGTAGALTLLPERPVAPVIVMNGDLLTQLSFDNLLQFHDMQGAAATMAVREYDFQVPYGVVGLEGERIDTVEEKPVKKFFVNAGIYVLSPEALDHLPPGRDFGMPALFEELIAHGEATAAYPLREYWIDIGQLDELERAKREWPENSK